MSEVKEVEHRVIVMPGNVMGPRRWSDGCTQDGEMAQGKLRVATGDRTHLLLSGFTIP